MAFLLSSLCVQKKKKTLQFVATSLFAEKQYFVKIEKYKCNLHCTTDSIWKYYTKLKHVCRHFPCNMSRLLSIHSSYMCHDALRSRMTIRRVNWTNSLCCFRNFEKRITFNICRYKSECKHKIHKKKKIQKKTSCTKHKDRKRSYSS